MFAGVPQVYLIEEAPEVELRGGLYYVTDRLEGQTIIRIFRPNTFLKTFARFGEQARAYRSGGADVIEFSDAVTARLGAS